MPCAGAAGDGSATLRVMPTPPTIATAEITALHRRRLRDVYRSAGWPCQDAIEIALLAAGLLERRHSALGHETLRVTDAGVLLIAETLQRNRARRDAHELLVERVAREMTRAGRLAWRALSLRAKVGERWAIAIPDVFSIRHTTVEAYLDPVVHEIKVNRADLLSDLRSASKRTAYLQLGSECWYVLRAGIGEADEIPAECGVMIATERAGEIALDVARPAPKRVIKMPLGVWMALARATPLDGWRLEEAQGLLGANGMGDRCEAPATGDRLG